MDKLLRYIELEPLLDARKLKDVIVPDDEHAKALSLASGLKNLKKATLILHHQSLNLLDVRYVFDSTMKVFPKRQRLEFGF